MTLPKERVEHYPQVFVTIGAPCRDRQLHVIADERQRAFDDYYVRPHILLVDNGGGVILAEFEGREDALIAAKLLEGLFPTWTYVECRHLSGQRGVEG